MPISHQYEWHETQQTVEIEIDLRGAKADNVDISSTDAFVRVNSPPYLTQIDFAHDVDEALSSARYEFGKLILSFPKKDQGLWHTLEFSGSKTEKQTRRANAETAKLMREQQLNEKRKEAKREQERLALKQQMALDEEQRRHLEEAKAAEKEQAEKELYDSFRQLEQPSKQSKPPLAGSETLTTNTKIDQKPSGSKSTNEIFTQESVTSTEFSDTLGNSLATSLDTSVQQQQQQDSIVESTTTQNTPQPHANTSTMQSNSIEKKYIPPPRNVRAGAPSKILLNFSKRAFPTPLRDSRKAEEEDWLARNRHRIEAKKKVERERQGVGENAIDAQDISERHPAWLKSKGDTFYSQKDFLGAINAYSAAIQRDNTFVAAWMNRAACQLQRGSLKHCIVDCTIAISLLPAIPSTNHQRKLTSTNFSDIFDAVCGDQMQNQLSRVGIVEGAYRNFPKSLIEEIQMNTGTQSETNVSLDAVLTLLPSSDESAKRMVIRAYTRRATALAQLGDFERARNDFIAAAVAVGIQQGLSCDESLHAVETDTLATTSSLSQNMTFMGLRMDAKAAMQLSQCTFEKRKGDAAFEANDFSSAIDFYSHAVQMAGKQHHFVGARINLSASRYALGDLPGAITDCNIAIKILEQANIFKQQQEPGQSMPSEYLAVPSAGSDLYKEMLATLYIRRANAYYALNLTEDAFDDLKKASALIPTETGLDEDLQLLAGRLAIRESSEEPQHGN